MLFLELSQVQIVSRQSLFPAEKAYLTLVSILERHTIEIPLDPVRAGECSRKPHVDLPANSSDWFGSGTIQPDYGLTSGKGRSRANKH